MSGVANRGLGDATRGKSGLRGAERPRRLSGRRERVGQATLARLARPTFAEPFRLVTEDVALADAR